MNYRGRGSKTLEKANEMLMPDEMVKSCFRVRAQALFMVFPSFVAEGVIIYFFILYQSRAPYSLSMHSSQMPWLNTASE
jgi:hypothetical protein